MYGKIYFRAFYAIVLISMISVTSIWRSYFKLYFQSGQPPLLLCIKIFFAIHSHLYFLAILLKFHRVSRKIVLDFFTWIMWKLHINFGRIDIILCLLFTPMKFPVNSFVFLCSHLPKIFLTDYLKYVFIFLYPKWYLMLLRPVLFWIFKWTCQMYLCIILDTNILLFCCPLIFLCEPLWRWSYS